MSENNVTKLTPELVRTLPGVSVLKTDSSHYNISFQNNPESLDVVRMANSILVAASRNKEWRNKACEEFAKALPGLLKNMGITITAKTNDDEIKRLKKSVEALTDSVKSYGGNPEKILKNAGL